MSLRKPEIRTTGVPLDQNENNAEAAAIEMLNQMRGVRGPQSPTSLSTVPSPSTALSPNSVPSKILPVPVLPVRVAKAEPTAPISVLLEMAKAHRPASPVLVLPVAAEKMPGWQAFAAIQAAAALIAEPVALSV